MMTDQINIKQINLHHCITATSLISRQMDLLQTKNQKLIVLIQEPWINRNIIRGFDENKVNLFYKRITNVRPRTCIVASKELNATLLPQYSSGDVTTVLINTKNGDDSEEFLLSSFYLPYEEQHKIPDDTARDAIEFSASSGIPIIIGADCNAHHILWGSSDTNSRGEKLVEYLATTSLDIQNRGIEPTFINKRRQEVLDITLVTQDLSNRINNWHVSCEDTLSDHREINFSLSCEVTTGELFRNPRNTDWSIFAKILKSKLNKLAKFNEISDVVQLEKAARALTKALTGAFKCACPGRLNTPKKNHWWNKELEKLKLETRRLFRLAKASRGSPNESEAWIALRKSRNTYTREIRRAQTDAWSNFCGSIEGAKATSKLHKLLAKDPAKGPGVLKKPSGEYTCNTGEAAKLLLDTHFPGNVVANSEHKCECVNCNSFAEFIAAEGFDDAEIEQITNYNRVNWAINSFQKYKSPGLDGIYPIMLQKGWDLIGKHIVNIYKACLNIGYVPNKWQEVKVVFIPKPGKDDYTSPKSFRPISLTSTLLKGLERLVDRHMKDFIDTTSGIHKSQHAYQQGKSTDTALHEVVSDVEDTFVKKEFAVGAFMDIAGAFDNLLFDAVTKSAEKLGINSRIIRWIKYMLSHRNITLKLNGQTMTVRATRGTPQGGVLSPTLWVIVMDSLLRELHQNRFKATAYADDVTIVCRGKFLSTISDRIQQAVKIVENWCKKVGLTVHPDKSEIVIFTKKINKNGFKNPKIFGKEIKQTSSAKYLGVILDEKLSWSKHVDMRIGKCLKIFWCCRSAIGRAWGLTPKSILWIYNAIVKPILAYGAFLWWYGVDTLVKQRKLSHLQRVACFAITGAMSTTPQNAMEVLLNMPKLELYIRAEAKNTAYRLRSCITDLQLTTSKHINVLKELYKVHPMLQATDDYIQTKYLFERKFEVQVPSKDDWIQGNTEVNYHSHVYFTDGAVSKHGSGYGALYAPRHSIIKGTCGPNVSITQAEIAAIHACCIDAMERNIQDSICIYSDSEGAINALKNCAVNSKLTMECISLLDELASYNTVNVIWLPSHSGIYGNEIADKIAKYAARESVATVEPHMLTARTVVRTLTDDDLAKQTNHTWLTTRKCEHTKSFVEHTQPAITEQMLNMSKADIRILTGIITGHCRMNSHLAKLRIRDDPDCDLCGLSAETAKHILCECNRLTRIRERIYAKSAIQPGEILKHPLQSVVSFYKKCSLINHHISRAFGFERTVTDD